jgi:hypothetical protein
MKLGLKTDRKKYSIERRVSSVHAETDDVYREHYYEKGSAYCAERLGITRKMASRRALHLKIKMSKKAKERLRKSDCDARFEKKRAGKAKACQEEYPSMTTIERLASYFPWRAYPREKSQGAVEIMVWPN